MIGHLYGLHAHDRLFLIVAAIRSASANASGIGSENENENETVRENVNARGSGRGTGSVKANGREIVTEKGSGKENESRKRNERARVILVQSLQLLDQSNVLMARFRQVLRLDALHLDLLRDLHPAFPQAPP